MGSQLDEIEGFLETLNGDTRSEGSIAYYSQPRVFNMFGRRVLQSYRNMLNEFNQSLRSGNYPPSSRGTTQQDILYKIQNAMQQINQVLPDNDLSAQISRLNIGGRRRTRRHRKSRKSRRHRKSRRY